MNALADGESRVRLEDVHLSIRGRAIFRGLSCRFPRGKISVILGGSGSGKSTLLRSIGGLVRPQRGVISVAGVDVSRLPERDLFGVRQRIGMLFQHGALLDAMSVYDNVALPLRLTGRRPARSDVLRVLEQVGLDGKAKRRPAELSGGQQQRVAIARALITRPSVFFADEPTGALDSGTSRQVLGLLREATDRAGQTVVMVTHDPVAAAYAERVLFLSDGLVAGHLDRATPAQIAAAMSELER